VAWLYVPLVIVHVFVAVALILIVLLQAGKGAALGAAFGGASQTVFGPRGPGSFLGKLTTAAAGIFMVTSLILAVFSSARLDGSVILTTPTPKTGTPTAPAETRPEPAKETAPRASEGAGGGGIAPGQGEGTGGTSPR